MSTVLQNSEEAYRARSSASGNCQSPVDFNGVTLIEDLAQGVHTVLMNVGSEHLRVCLYWTWR